MKRILLLIATMLLTIGAFAQISGVQTRESAKTIAKFRAGSCSLNCFKDVYYLSLTTTNQFDDHVLVNLGEGKDSTIQTLQDLLELHKSMETGETAEFTILIKGKPKKYYVSKADAFNFAFLDTGTAGTAFFATMEMKSLIKKLQKLQ